MLKWRNVLLLLLAAMWCRATFAHSKVRSKELFNKDWKFFSGDDKEASRASYKDSWWRRVTLPHDWSIEGDFSNYNPARPEGGALPTGIGWYRKTFVVPGSKGHKEISIMFDGIYQQSEVWINGRYLGKRPNGYISFSYDLTPYLRWGKPNVIAVRVDNSGQPNSRWYSGSGIYRNVWLETKEKLHVDQWGTFVTTPRVNKEEAVISVATEIRNHTGMAKEGRIRQSLIDSAGKLIGSKETPFIISGSSLRTEEELTVNKPKLWSIETPYLYTMITEIYDQRGLIDRYQTPFGIRYFTFDQAKGFSLNGQSLKILGVCLHHDLGALGSAVHYRAIQRQLELLKSMGCNGIRTSHNPPAPELLELCDKMGFIVMDETFDMWMKKKNAKDYHLDFARWHQKDLEDHIRRDRNHPSVFMWSIGNEIREQFDTSGIRITRELASIVKRLDATRPITSALTEMDPTKNNIYRSGALDILGFNYNHDKFEQLPAKFPGQKFIASETTSAIETRGHYDMPSDQVRRWPKDAKSRLTDGNADYTASAYDNISAYWGSTHEETWKTVKKLNYIAGLFVWTGFDYLGEPVPYPWPARSAYFGILDLAGFPKDAFYLYQSEWTNRPVLHLFPHWNWPEGKVVDVWAYYNNADEVELFLNGKSLGVRKKQGEDLHVMWRVVYQPGVLRIVSRKEGKLVLVREIKTAGKPAKIELIPDRIRIKADGSDLAYVTVRVLDKDGNVVPDADNLIRFKIKGCGVIAGVDNGYQASQEPFKSDRRKAFNGVCLAIVQATDRKGKIELRAESEGLTASVIGIKSK